MESPDEVRASLAVLPLGDLTDHEETSPAVEARVREFLAEAGALSWPLVVDAASGLILDGSHRARVLRREHAARFVLVQQVSLDHPAVRVGTWCRIFDGVAPTAFAAVAHRVGLEPGAGGELSCHYGGRVYGRPDLTPAGAYELVRELEATLGGNGSAGPVRFAEEEDAAADLGTPGTLLVRPPVLDKATVRARAVDGRLPPKSTRFLLPYRVFGLPVPLRALAGPRPAVEAWVEAHLDTPLVRLGEGLTVDRRYPERLWQFADYRVPRTLFARPTDHARYEAALAGAVVEIASTA